MGYVKKAHSQSRIVLPANYIHYRWFISLLITSQHCSSQLLLSFFTFSQFLFYTHSLISVNYKSSQTNYKIIICSCHHYKTYATSSQYCACHKVYNTHSIYAMQVFVYNVTICVIWVNQNDPVIINIGGGSGSVDWHANVQLQWITVHVMRFSWPLNLIWFDLIDINLCWFNVSYSSFFLFDSVSKLRNKALHWSLNKEWTRELEHSQNRANQHIYINSIWKMLSCTATFAYYSLTRI